MHTRKDSPLYLISVDMDGTVAAPNQKLSGVYEKFLRALQKLPRIEVVLNSGKSVKYLEREAARINGRYIIAMNGAAMQILGGDRMVFGGHRKDIVKLRHLLGLTAEDEGVKPIHVKKDTFNVAVEEEKGDMVLTLFTEPEWVKHRWQFDQGLHREEMHDYLKKLIKEHDLHLHVLEPHPDGAVDVVRLYHEKPIDKSSLPKMVREVWSHAKVKQISMFGDGSNDVPALTAPSVVGFTFPEASVEKVIKPVLKSGGYVTARPAWIKSETGTYTPGGGVIEGIRTLAYKGFFEDYENEVTKICDRYLKQIPAAA